MDGLRPIRGGVPQRSQPQHHPLYVGRPFSIRMPARHAAPVLAGVLGLAALLAGCQDPSPPAPGPEGLAAPEWATGMRWNYTIQDGEGMHTGWIHFVVVGEEDVDGHPTYRVEVTRWDAGDMDHDGVAGETRAHVENYDRATLHNRNPCGQLDGCSPDIPVFDFPLQDGKAWQYYCCGDLQVEYRATARLDDGAWRLMHQTVEGGQVTRAVHYSPAVGFATTWEFSPEGSVEERWALAESSRER